MYTQLPTQLEDSPLIGHAGSDLDSIGFVSKSIKTLKLIADILLPGEDPVAPPERPELICPNPCPLPQPDDSAMHNHYMNVVSRLAEIIRIDGAAPLVDMAKEWSAETGKDRGHFEHYFGEVSQGHRDTNELCCV